MTSIAAETGSIVCARCDPVVQLSDIESLMIACSIVPLEMRLVHKAGVLVAAVHVKKNEGDALVAQPFILMCESGDVQIAFELCEEMPAKPFVSRSSAGPNASSDLRPPGIPAADDVVMSSCIEDPSVVKPMHVEMPSVKNSQECKGSDHSAVTPQHVKLRN